MADETGNIELQKQLNALVSERNAFLSKQNDILRDQLSITQEFMKLLGAINGSMKSMDESLQQSSQGAAAMKSALASTTSQAQEADRSIKDIAVAAVAATKGLDKMGEKAEKSLKMIVSVGEAIGDAFERTGAEMDSLLGILESVVKSVFGIGTALISIPLKVFGLLTEKAAELSNASTALRQAYEDVREAFGDLRKTEAKGVIDSFNELRRSGGSLAGTGLSLSKIYGWGPEGLAQALNELRETAVAMGATFGVLQGQFEKNADKILIMQKGLGLSNEDMKALGQIAIATGGDMTKMMQDMGNLALQMGAKFGISSKLLGRDLGYMTTNMGKFGSMTKVQMATSAVYVRKLGLEIKEIEGLLGAFDNFEDAAGNAAKLAQGFGMTVDAMKMMKEQDPAKRLDMLRQAFAATGRSIESMSRQERAMLAQSAGLDENMVSLALSNKNMGKSYEDIQREAEKSNKKQLTQTEVLNDLSKNIRRLIQTMQTSGSFLTQFLNGFMMGISRTKEFRQLMRELSSALRETLWFGYRVGKMTMDVFPGLKDTFKAMSAIFEPRRFKSLVHDLEAIFRKFFIDINKDPVEAVKKFVGLMRDRFEGFFSMRSKEGVSFKRSIMTFGKAMAGILAGAGVYLVGAATEMLKALADYLRNPDTINSVVGEGAGSIISVFVDVFKGAFPPLWAAIQDVFWLLFDKAGPWIAKIGLALLAKNLAGAALNFVWTGIASSLSTFVKTSIKKALTTSTAEAITASAGSAEVAASAEGAVAGIGALLSNPVGWAVAAGLLLTAIGAAIAGVLKMIGEDRFLSMLGVDPNSWIGKIVDQWYWNMVTAFDFLTDGIWELFEGMWEVLSSLFSGDTGKFEEGFEHMFNGLSKSLLGSIVLIGDTLYSVVTGIPALIIRALATAVEGIASVIADDLFQPLIHFLFESLAEYFGYGIDMTEKLSDKFSHWINDKTFGWLGTAKDAVTKGADDVTKSVASAGEKIGNAAVESGKAAADGMSTGILSGFKDLPKSTEDILGDVTSLAGEYTKKSKKQIALQAEDINRGLENIRDLVSKIDQTKVASIDSAMKGVNMDAISRAKESIASLSDGIMGILDPLRDIVEAISGIMTLSDKFTPVSVSNAISNIVSTVNNINGLLSGGITVNTATVNDTFAKSIAQADTSIKGISKTLETLTDSVSFLESQLEGIARVTEDLRSYREIQLSGVVRAVVADIASINKSLANLGNIDVNATVDRLGENLQLKNEVLNIERKPIQMTVNLNLTMKAEDIAKEILDVSQKATLKSDAELFHSSRRFLGRE